MIHPYGQTPAHNQIPTSQHQFPHWGHLSSWSFAQQAPNYTSPAQTQGLVSSGDDYAPMQIEDTSKLSTPPIPNGPVQTRAEMDYQHATGQIGFLPLSGGLSSEAQPKPSLAAMADVTDSAGPKQSDDMMEFPSFDPDVRDYNQQLGCAEEEASLIDLRHCQPAGVDSSQISNDIWARRFSESTHSLSSAGGMYDMTPYEEAPTADFTSDCDAAWNSLEQAVNLLSPASPRRPTMESSRSGGRPRASPLQYSSVRTSPYPMEIGRRTRWSTGGVASTGPPSTGHSFSSFPSLYSPFGSRLNHHHSMPMHPNFPSNNPLPMRSHSHDAMGQYPCVAPGHNPIPLFPPLEPPSPDVSSEFPTQRFFRLLHSNVESHCGSSSLGHLADLSDPPDLYASLEEEPSNPPDSDMNPSDPDMMPHEQDLRFGGDLYTPRWVRGHGNKREGWCGLCKPGRWLVLKNSAFWYDKSFTHGVSAATGTAFQSPQETRRTEGNPDQWEGLCGSCGEWFALVSNKKKGTTWFRHAYKV